MKAPHCGVPPATGATERGFTDHRDVEPRSVQPGHGKTSRIHVQVWGPGLGHLFHTASELAPCDISVTNPFGPQHRHPRAEGVPVPTQHRGSSPARGGCGWLRWLCGTQQFHWSWSLDPYPISRGRGCEKTHPVLPPTQHPPYFTASSCWCSCSLGTSWAIPSRSACSRGALNLTTEPESISLG